MATAVVHAHIYLSCICTDL